MRAAVPDAAALVSFMSKYRRKQRPPLRIRFRVDHGTYRRGQVAEVPYLLAIDLMLKDIADPHIKLFKYATPPEDYEVR